MAEIAFKIKKLKINNIEFITGTANPNISGLDAPVNSIFFNEINGYHFRKFNTLNTDWEQTYPKNTARSVSASGNILRDDNILLVNSTSGNITLTLPDPSFNSTVTVKKTVNLNKIIINPFLTELIDGSSSSLEIKNINTSVILTSDGTNWYII